MRHISLFSFLLSSLILPVSGAGWLNPADGGVVILLNSEDNQFSFWSGPDGQEEWELNHGSLPRSRVKGWQDITGLVFADLDAHLGKTVLDAELHLAKADEIPIFGLVASTINTEWHESSACWRWRDKSKKEDWTFSHSDFGTASFGNYGSLVSFGYKASGTFGTYSSGGYTWVRMKLDPQLVHALMIDQHGLAVTDVRGRNGQYNPRV